MNGGAAAAVQPSQHSLEIRGGSKTFGYHRALSNVDLRIDAGSIHALLGQNGSGKSTLIKVLSGYHAADPGTRVFYNGEEVDVDAGANDSWRKHLRFVHQDLALVETLSAVENLALERGFTTGFLGRIHWRAEQRRARELMSRLGVQLDVTVPIASLSPAERTMVAIARALQDWDDSQYTVLVLDEPTASLARDEADRLYAAVAAIAARGAGVLLVTHHLDEVLRVADRFTVLRNGNAVASDLVADTDVNRLVELIIGRSVERFYAEHPAPSGDVVLRVENLAAGAVGPLSFEVKAGEIVGFAGVDGSGREAVASLLSGARDIDSGDIRVNGRPVPSGNVRAAMREGIVLLPADRKLKGIVGELSVRENLLVSCYADVRRGWHSAFAIQRRSELKRVNHWFDALEVRPPDPEAAIGTLSGGNQQKVVLSRVLRLRPRVLVLDEPTQGVDIGARAKIYEQIAEAARGGAAIVLCSSTDEELANECDRVIVLRGGRIAATLSGSGLSEDAVSTECLRPLEAARNE